VIHEYSGKAFCKSQIFPSRNDRDQKGLKVMIGSEYVFVKWIETHEERAMIPQKFVTFKKKEKIMTHSE